MVVLSQSINLTLPILQLLLMLSVYASIHAAYPPEHAYYAEYEQANDFTEFIQKRSN